MRNDVIAMLRQGSSYQQVADACGVTRQHARVIRMRAGLPKRGNRRYAVKSGALTPSPALDYWTGFLMADGCVHGSVVRCVCAERDAKHIAAMADFFGGAPPRIGSRGEVDWTTFWPELVATLRAAGVVERKSKTAMAADRLTTSAAFWRGTFDGDGWIGWNRVTRSPQAQHHGAVPLLGQFVRFLDHHGISAEVRPHKSIARVALSGARARAMLALLYSGEPALPRKAERAAAIAEGRMLTSAPA